MKRIHFVPDVEMTDVFGEPMRVTRESNGVRESARVVQDHPRFMLERTGDARYAGGRRGVDAVEFVIAARKELRDQADLARERGYWLIEDDRAEAMRRATLEPEDDYLPQLRHNLLPFLDAVRSAIDWTQS